MKKCEMCGEMHPISEFSRVGFAYSICKQCELNSFDVLTMSEMLKSCPSTISNLIRRFNIKAMRLGKKLLVSAKDFDNFKVMFEDWKNKPYAERFERGVEMNELAKQGLAKCSTCGKILPISQFWKDRSKRLGIAAQCCDCKRKSQKSSIQRKRMQELIPSCAPQSQKDTEYSAENMFAPSSSPIATQANRNKRLKPTAPIKERKEWFINSIRESNKDYPKDMLNDFYLYWSELTLNGWMRFELEPTWDTIRRLGRWFMRHINTHSSDLTSSAQCAVVPTPPKVEQEPTIPYPEEPTQSSPTQAVAPTPPKVEPTPPPTPKEEQPVEQATYSPQTLTIRFKAGDKVIRLKDGIFLLEQLSGKAQVNMGEKPEILYETTDGDMVADKDLFKNKREALERTKLAGIPEERLTYGNKPIK